MSSTHVSEFDAILSEATEPMKYVGSVELSSLSRCFGVDAREMHLVYLDRLLRGYSLPLLVVNDKLLEEEMLDVATATA